MHYKAKEEEPLVSVIVPCYNYGHFLADALRSVQRQTYKNIECVVIDDGSVDNTSEVAGLFCESDTRFRYYYQKNSGASSARNYGIRMSSGQFLQFLDSDDLIMPEKIELQMRVFSGNSDIDIVYSGFKYFSSCEENMFTVNDELVEDTWTPKVSGHGNDLLDVFFLGNIAVTQAILVRKKAIQDVGFFDESFRTMEDWQFWLRFAIKNKNFFYLDNLRCLSFVRKGHSSLMSDNGLLNSDSLRLCNWMIDAISEHGLSQSWVNKAKRNYVDAMLGVKKIDKKILFDAFMRRHLLKRFLDKMMKK